MKIPPCNENNHHQAAGRHYKEPVQSAQSSMQQSSSVSPVTVTQNHAPNNIRNENSNATYADHHIHQSSFHSTSNASEEEILSNNEDEGCSEQSEILQSSSLSLTAEPEGSKGIENCPNCEEDDAPIPAAQIAARYESLEETAKKPDIIEEDDESPPFLPWQIGCKDEDLSTKKSYLTTSNHPSISECQPSAPPAIDVVVPPSTSDIERNMSNSTQPAVEIIIHRPPPPSMLPRQSDDDEEEPSDDLPSLPQIEATAVEDVVYDAIAVPSSDANQEDKGDQESTSWWKRNQKYMFVWLMALVIGAMAATIATLVGSKDDANTVVPVETLQSTVSINDTQYTMSPSNTTTSTTKPSTAVS